MRASDKHGYISGERAAHRVHDLLDRGYKIADIARATGVSAGIVRHIHTRNQKIHFLDEAAVLTAAFDEYAPGYRVQVDLALPLIQKLLDDGWSRDLLASTIGLTRFEFNGVFKPATRTVPRHVFDTLTQLVPPKDEPFHGECTYAGCTQPAEDNELRQCAEHARQAYAVLKWELREEVNAS